MSHNKPKDWKKFKEESFMNEDEEILRDDAELLDDEIDSFEERSSLDHPTYVDLEEKLTLAEQKAHENWEKATRAMAELENVRRRAERDVANAHKFSLERFIDSLLPVLDSLEQALQLVDKDSHPSMYEGMMLTRKLFLDVLLKQQVQQLDPTGEIFDPQQHEAMSMQPSADKASNTILMVVQKGYKLHDRVIRPARVIVAK